MADDQLSMGCCAIESAGRHPTIQDCADEHRTTCSSSGGALGRCRRVHSVEASSEVKVMEGRMVEGGRLS